MTCSRNIAFPCSILFLWNTIWAIANHQQWLQDKKSVERNTAAELSYWRFSKVRRIWSVVYFFKLKLAENVYGCANGKPNIINSSLMSQLGFLSTVELKTETPNIINSYNSMFSHENQQFLTSAEMCILMFWPHTKLW